MREGRRELIAVLGWSLDDLLPLPVTGTGSIVRGSAVRGEGPSHRVGCSACDGLGRVVDRFGRSSRCDACAGRGQVSEDGYTGRQVASVSEPATAVRSERVGCSWCQDAWSGSRSSGLPRGSGVRGGVRCAACDGSGWRELTVVDAVGDGGSGVRGGGREAQLERRAASGSYRELERVLAGLRDVSPRAWRAWWGGYLDPAGWREGSDGSGRSWSWLDEGWFQVCERMPGRVRVPEGVLVAWRRWREGVQPEPRDVVIRRRVLGGEPVSVVAAEVGLSVRRVQRIAYGGVS